MIRVLILEDVAAHAELVELELKRAALEFAAQRVVTRPDYQDALREFRPDVIISDHDLPHFTGAEALELARMVLPSAPFILVTGSLNEEMAVEYMKAGAADYILRDRLARLGPAVRAALGRRRVEQELQKRDQYFKALIDQGTDIIAVVDAVGAIRYTNTSVLTLLGYRPDEVVGQLLLNFLHPDDVVATLDVFAEGVTTGKGTRYLELRFLHKDGSYRVLEAVGRYLIDDPIVEGVVINARDVTERRSLERQLLQAQKMEAVGRLASGVAHDFNNVLTAILGHTELLLDGLPTLSPLRPDLEEIRKSAGRATGLTRQLLAFSRKQTLDTRVLDLNEVAFNMDKLLRRLLGEDIDVVTQLQEGLGAVRADAGQLEQVLANLAVNARDAMPEGGRLTIETRNVELDDAYAKTHVPLRPGRYVMMAVSDTGIGMSADTMNHMFEPFFTTKQPGEGTGLGLSTVYGIVKQSGGYVLCYSELGEGTTFKVYLPRVDAPLDHPTRATARAARTRGWETILLVEDETTLRDLTGRMLEKYGYTVLEAGSAEQALVVAGRHKGVIHLLLTDVVLPGANGRALADELCSRRADLKVAFMSGYTEAAMIRRGMLDPQAAFISKPYTAEQLAGRVREVLDGHNRLPS
jgi:PAS domain S-box-containing protein